MLREQDDKKMQKLPGTPGTPGVNDPASSGSDEINWDRLSVWCQGFLDLPDSELNSLWYERLAEAASSQYSKGETVISLYQRATAKASPSWLCHKGLGKAHFDMSQEEGATDQAELALKEAITQVELALKEAGREAATPKPEEKDIVDLHLQLGEYAYEAGDIEKAVMCYLYACKSEDAEQARKGQMGHLKARLDFPNMEERRQVLHTMLGQDGENGMVSILKAVARDDDHDTIVSKVLTAAKGDRGLLEEIVRAMETATPAPRRNDDQAAGVTEAERFAEAEIRGVLLCDRAMAAYMYNVSPDGTEPVAEALRLWVETRDLLSDLGGSNAYRARQNATAALAQHYFQNMVDGEHLNHVDALEKLGKDDPYITSSDSVGFRGVLYTLRGEVGQARTVLEPRMREALQILSDDWTENDFFGFSSIHKTVAHCKDFDKAAIALSLASQPDLVFEALHFKADDIITDNSDGDGDGKGVVDKERVLDLLAQLAKETVRAVKSQVPDSSQQVQRIEAAKVHVDALVAAAATTAKLVVNGGHHGQADAPSSSSSYPTTNGEAKEGKPTLVPTTAETTAAHRLLQSRVSDLIRKHTPKIDVRAFYYCDGRTLDGKRCQNRADFTHNFYHCIYCSNRDFCGDCLQRLRYPDSDSGGGALITVCSAKHRWFLIPAQGSDFYVGPAAKYIPSALEARPTEKDENIIEIRYAETSKAGKEGTGVDMGTDDVMTVEAWKEALAREWDISLDDIKKEMSQPSTPDGLDQSEQEGGGQQTASSE